MLFQRGVEKMRIRILPFEKGGKKGGFACGKVP
jgi:hypothetical protein